MEYLTSGESHGPELTVIINKIPSGIKIDKEFIDNELRRRQLGYGRGKRMSIEKDKIDIVSGVRFGKTTGAPITFKIKNRDWENWTEKMSVLEEKVVDKLTLPRPGHSDYAGLMKYCLDDIRNVLERSSARETAVQVAFGGFCKLVLKEFGIDILSHTVSIGKIKITKNYNFEDLQKIYNDDVLRCIDKTAEQDMKKLIEKTKNEGDTLGGVFEVIVRNLIPGLGSHIQYNTKLDSALACALISIQGVKGVEFGTGFEGMKKPGSEIHDAFDLEKGKIIRKTNNAGGIESGISNGCDIVVRCAMKPIPTLMNALQSVDIKTKEIKKAIIERSDVCVVPAAGVVGESYTANVILNKIFEEFGYDNIDMIKKRYFDKKEYLIKEYNIGL